MSNRKLRHLFACTLVLAATISQSARASQRTVRLAICQILVIDSDREGNFRRIEYALADAEAAHAQTLRSFLSRRSSAGRTPRRTIWPRPIPGKDSDRIADLARKYKVMIAIGLDEKDGDRLYDSAILVDKIRQAAVEASQDQCASRADDAAILAGPARRHRRGRDGVRPHRGADLRRHVSPMRHLQRLKALKPDLMLVPYGWAAPNDKWPRSLRRNSKLW